MNITTDNYEAYLLDYVEGNLSPEGAAELRQFVAAQGLDWDELTEELPHLEAPALAYENKEGLKKKATVMPLYVKIASAAAAAGLLLTVGLWPEKSLPKVEPIAELKPVAATGIERPLERLALQTRPTQFVKQNVVVREKNVEIEKVAMEKTEMPLVAELPSIKTGTMQIESSLPDFDKPDFGPLAYQMNTNMAFAYNNGNSFEDETEGHESLSLVGRGLLWLTNGRHSSFASLINSGVSQAKQDLSEAATDIAMTAYYRADERFEEVKENWQDKRGE